MHKNFTRTLLCLASVLAAGVFAPEAAAIPAFARQTGMACNACHQQHFPVLNAFGRAFKDSGYTIVGKQGVVEADHLSIPDTLNAAILIKIRYFKDQSTGAADTTTTATNKGNGQLQFGDEVSLFFGGRIANNVGFLMEGNLVGGAGQFVTGLRIPFVFDVGGAKLSMVPFTTDGGGVQTGYELSSGGVQRSNRWNENRREISAVQYNADRGPDGGAATGVALVARNDLGFINLTRWTPSYMPGGGSGASSSEMKSTYLRVAATPSIGSWALVVGAGGMSGTSFNNVSGQRIDTKQTFVDFQAHGSLAGKDLGLYAQHATAPAKSGTSAANAYNGGANQRSATTFGADYSLIPHVLSLAASYRNAKNGGAAGRDGDNALLVGAIYDYRQNIALHASYITYSGSAYNTSSNKRVLMGMLEMAW